MQLTLDWGNILVLVLTATVGFVYNTLKAHTDSQVTSLREQCAANIASLTDRMNRADNALSLIPNQFEKVAEALRRIELQLANNHPTKIELKDLESSVQRLSEQMARAVSADDDALPAKRVRRK